MNGTALDAAEQLAEILQRENEALRRVDYAAATTLVPAKQAALAALPNDIPAAMATRISTLATENQALLEKAITVQTHVVRIIAQAAAPPPATRHYDRHGAPPLSRRSAALALSTRV